MRKVIEKYEKWITEAESARDEARHDDAKLLKLGI